MAFIYHVTSKAEWEESKAKGFYAAASLQSEGFIHCSEEHQVEGVLQRYFAGKTDLVKLGIDTEKLGAGLQYDFSPSLKETFPHVYGPLNLDAVVEVTEL